MSSHHRNSEAGNQEDVRPNDDALDHSQQDDTTHHRENDDRTANSAPNNKEGRMFASDFECELDELERDPDWGIMSSIVQEFIDINVILIF